MADAPLGYLTAYTLPGGGRPPSRSSCGRGCWPEPIIKRPSACSWAAPSRITTARCSNVRKLLDTWDCWAAGPCQPASPGSCSPCLRKSRSTIGSRCRCQPRGGRLRAAAEPLVERLAPMRRTRRPPRSPGGRARPSLTFAETADRRFEEAYWKTIALLATGQYVNKDNADCVRDPATQSQLSHYDRDLESLGDYLLEYYRRLVAAAGMAGARWSANCPSAGKPTSTFPGRAAG